MLFIDGRQAGLRSERSVSIGQAGPEGAISANEQKMIRRNHDFPPQILRPLPGDDPRRPTVGNLLFAKRQRIFF